MLDVRTFEINVDMFAMPFAWTGLEHILIVEYELLEIRLLFGT